MAYAEMLSEDVLPLAKLELMHYGSFLAEMPLRGVCLWQTLIKGIIIHT